MPVLQLLNHAQVHFIGNNQLRIGEENLDDILEPNTVMMAFFARDEPEIVGLNFRFAVTNYEIQNDTLVGPANWTTFAWVLQRSRFISCRKDFAILYRKTYPQYFSGKRRIRNEVILTLQKFRNWAIERGMTPILYAGTLLGWYRECGIIPYTHDIDFTVFIEQYYNKFPEDVMNSSFIKLSMRFNRPDDLLEYKVYIEDGVPTDTFFLYHDQNTSGLEVYLL
uniref:LPS biosynthesis protein n=1 Tax=Loa loa TaxID=7209 RepID=A0A1I7VCP4_LOALO